MLLRKTALVLILLFIIPSVADAGVISFSIKPEHPVKGDIVTIYGTAQPNEDVRIAISFEKTVPVRDGEFVFSVKGVKIPVSRNRFTVTAYGCDDLKVSVRIFFIWVTLGSEAVNGVATVSRSNVPSGTYDVIIHGRSSKSRVRLKITAVGYIKADRNGYFKYSYDTSSIPPGEFVISVGGKTKVVTLAERSNQASSMPASSISGGGAVPTETVETPAPAKTPTPVEIPKATPTPAVRKPEKNATRMQNVTPIPTVKNLAKRTPARTGQKTTVSVRIPGFDLISCLAAISSAYLMRRRI